jgi:hypothetical protein
VHWYVRMLNYYRTGRYGVFYKHITLLMTCLLKPIYMVVITKWWDRKFEKIKNYSVLKLGNELSRGTNNEQAERIVINRDEFDRRVLIAAFGHQHITMIPFIKVDRSKKIGSPNLDVNNNVGREPTTLDFTMRPTKSSSSQSSLDLIFKGSIHNISQLPVMSLYCSLLVETVVHSLEDASYFLNWLLKLRREKRGS